MLNSVDIIVELGILYLKMCLFHQMRYLLELIVSIIRMVEHDAVEHLGEVSVKVEFDRAALVTSLL